MGFSWRVSNSHLLPQIDCDTCLDPVGAKGLVACHVEPETSDMDTTRGVDRDDSRQATVVSWDVFTFCNSDCIAKYHTDHAAELDGEAVETLGYVRDYLGRLCVDLKIDPATVAAEGLGLLSTTD